MAIEGLRSNRLDVKPLQEYHRELKLRAAGGVQA
jgi:hypothetical protein